MTDKGIRIHSRLLIPHSELEWTYMRSSGPGGQNVNRTNSCAVLRWNWRQSESLHHVPLPEWAQAKLQTLATNDGDLIIKCQTFRDQERNYQECLHKFQKILESVFHRPKKRIATKPTKSSKRRRLQTKKIQGEKKSTRQKVTSRDI